MKISIERNAALIFLRQQRSTCIKTDRLFTVLLLVQWFACIGIAIWISPKAWAGVNSTIHIHLLEAIFLGGLLFALPAYLTLKRPGKFVTRLSIGLSQALFSSLIILLTGGRIESHFHIFVSLGLLSFYLDKRVVLLYSSVVLLDHLLRGIFWPFSMYGVSSASPLRTLEHAFWVIATVVCIFQLFRDRLAAIRGTSRAQAELIATKSSIEEQVCTRTKELLDSQSRMATQHAITFALSEAPTLKHAAPIVIKALCSRSNWHYGAIWTMESKNDSLNLDGIWPDSDGGKDSPGSTGKIKLETSELLLGIFASNKPTLMKDVDPALDPVFQHAPTIKPIQRVLIFPIRFQDQTLGAVLLCGDSSIDFGSDQSITQTEAIGEQIGAYIIRKEKEAQAALMANLVENANDAIVTVDTQSKIISWNRAAERQYGYSQDEIMGQSIRVLLRPDDPVSNKDLREILTGKQVMREDVHVRKDGSLVDVQVTFAVVPDAIGSSFAIAGIIRDVTAQKEAERRIGEFYSTVSHELRTPLTSICGALGLIEGGVLEREEELDLVQVARRSADRLVRLINDMLDLKKLETGKMELSINEIVPQDIVGQALDSISSLATESQVALQAEIKCNGTFNADSDRVLQMLTNLIGNAIKFSPVQSTVKVLVETRNPNRLRFSVVDQGAGIPSHQMHKLFGRFQQLDSSDTRPKGGTGLGLAITKALAEQHGGEIGVDSEIGKGSTFWFELPGYSECTSCASGAGNNTEAAAAGCVEDRGSSNGKDHNVLVIEANEALSSMLLDGLRQHGYACIHSRSLAESREILSHSQPEIILLDLTLPDGNGLDLVEEMNNNNERSRIIPIILITNHERSVKDDCGAVVVDESTGPFNPRKLFIAMQHALQKDSLKNVLIVDDDPELRKVLTRQIEKAGIRCLQAEDGAQAIEVAKQNVIDLLIMDVVMPNIDGFHLVEILKRGSLRFVPLIVYSGKDLEAEQREQLTLGSTKYLMKGKVKQQELADIVSELLRANAASSNPDPITVPAQ